MSNIKKRKIKKKKPLEVIVEYSNAPDAEERWFRAMSILLPEKDILVALLEEDKLVKGHILPQESKN